MSETDDPKPTQGPRGELTQDRYVAGKDLTAWHSSFGRWLAAISHRVSGWLGPNKALAIVLALGAVVAAGAALLASEVYESVTDADGVALLDQPMLDAMLAIRTPLANELITAYTDIGGVIGMPILATAIMIALAVRRRSWTPVILMLAAGGGSLLMTVVGKEMIGRVRPELADAVPPYEHSPSFPSGHTLNAIVIAGIVAYLLILRQQTRIAQVLTITVAAIFAITIGLSRVYLGHHWFTDVLVAWVLGLAWLAAIITAHRLYLTSRKRIRREHGPTADVAETA